MARLTAAVVEASPAISAMLGEGVTMINAKAFVNAVRHVAPPEFPLLACVDVTVAAESEARASLLTHGLRRYGRAEVYVTAPRPGSFEDALELTFAAAEVVLRTDKPIPDGDTIGPSAAEKVPVKRSQSPPGNGTVIRLEIR